MPSRACDNSALAGGIPAFENDNGPFSGPEIGLLDRLHDTLHRFQPALIARKPNRWMLGDLGQRGALGDNEIFPLHS
jgi:hypothetical protein